MIDTLDAYSLLVEARVVDIVLIDFGSDVRGKIDLVVERRSERVQLRKR